MGYFALHMHARVMSILISVRTDVCIIYIVVCLFVLDMVMTPHQLLAWAILLASGLEIFSAVHRSEDMQACHRVGFTASCSYSRLVLNAVPTEKNLFGAHDLQM